MNEFETASAVAGSHAAAKESILGKSWYRSSVFWRITSALFLIWAVLLFAGWYFWHQVEAETRNERITDQLIVDAEGRSTELQRWYETAIQTAKLSILHPAVRGFTQDRTAAKDYFTKLAGEVERFSQLRILRPDGMEVVRVDQRDDHVFVVPDNQLQSKAGRYYFEAAQSLRPGQVYISRLDLNVEHGRLEIPFHPTSRLIAPIISEQNGIIGYFAINLDMEKPLTGVSLAMGEQTEHELLNRDGYWLAGAPDEKLWGFARDVPVALSLESPDLWQKITRVSARGGFIYDDVIYRVAVLSVEDLAKVTGQNLVLPDQPKIYIVAKAPVYSALSDTHPIEYALLGLMLLVLAGVSCLLGYLAVRRKQADEIQQRIEANLVSVQSMASLGRIVAGVAHEMRTPMGNALTVSTTLTAELDEMSVRLAQRAEEVVDREEIDHLKRGLSIIQKNIERASALLRNFRETAADQSNHTRRKFDLVGVVKNMVGTLEQQLAKKGISLTFSGPENAPIDSYSDAVDQVLVSLINNAERHAFIGRSSGQVDLQVVDLDDQFYQVIVADDGTGIDIKDQKRVFEPFWSSDHSERGSGLGLAIVANIVVGVLGGEVILRSEPGIGSNFILTIPKVVPDRTITSPYIFEDAHKNSRTPFGRSKPRVI